MRIKTEIEEGMRKKEEGKKGCERKAARACGKAFKECVKGK